jgi:methionyl aminopeptidase
MKQAGSIATAALKEIEKHLKIGSNGLELDRIASSVIKSFGAEPSFHTVDNYRYSICVTENDKVVHGLPTKEPFQNGDVVGIDIGALFKGLHSDLAETYVVGRAENEVTRFLDTGKQALKKAIAAAQVGGRVGDISQAIQEIVEGAGYSVVKELVGHGVGTKLHEEPLIPGLGKAGSGPKLEEGMTIAIEVIYSQGKPEIVLLSDGWSIATRDGSLAGLFERTVALTKKGPVVLTPL